MKNFTSIEDECVPQKIKEAFALNEQEMRRRRFLLGKEKLNRKESRELEILELRCFLSTKEDFLKAMEHLKKWKDE